MAAALPYVAAATGVYGAISSNKNQKRAVRSQEGIANNQSKLFRQTTPYYGAILQYLAQNAGIQVPGATPTPARVATGTPNNALAPSPLPSGSGALPDSSLGIFNQNAQDRLAFAQAEDDLGRVRDRRDQALRHRLHQRGAGEATISSALAQNEGDYMGQLAAFRRQIALAARAEQERRVAQLLGAMNPGLGAGGAASAAFGGQANMYGGQAAAAGAGMGSFLSNWLLAEAMRRQNPSAQPGAPVAPGETDPFTEWWKRQYPSIGPVA